MQKITETAKIIITSCLFISAGAASALAGEAHTHIGHVVSGWNDTPSGKGLLPTALKESIVAAAHANYAAKALDDLDTMQFHSEHVRHAIDPTLVSSGPGLGYGFLKAANGAAKHTTLASESADASGNVKTHAVHVLSSLQNAIERGEMALIHADAILAATTAEEAAPHAKLMAELTEATFKGVDANGDGNISWKKGEGGLKTADKHIGFILDGEGLSR